MGRSSAQEKQAPRPVIEKVLGMAEDLCRQGHFVQACHLLEDTACRKEFDLSAPWGPRYRSYYGLSLAMAYGQVSRGERLCKEALETNKLDPDLAHNLGLVYLRCRRRDLAFRTFRHIQRQFPQHRPTESTIEQLGVRKRPLFPFLPRSNPINKYTGILIQRARQAWAPQTAA
jgi:hypothetical protein